MAKPLPIVPGQKINKLIAIEKVGKNKHGWIVWKFKCDCGKEANVTSYHFFHGITKSCGCSVTESNKSRATHGHSRLGKRSPEYVVWSGIVDRTTNPKSKYFPMYGGRGIFLCDRWRRFENFLADVGPRPSLSLSLDRINNEDGYHPTNVRWASALVQGRNRRGCRKIEYEGKIYTVSELAEKHNIKRGTLSQRINKYGWSIEKALTEPIEEQNMDGSYSRYQQLTVMGETKTLQEFCGQYRISRAAVLRRVKRMGWDFEKAITTPLLRKPRTPKLPLAA